jgi:hypothetical protein
MLEKPLNGSVWVPWIGQQSLFTVDRGEAHAFELSKISSVKFRL